MAELEDEKVLLNKTSFDWKDLLNETIEMYSTTVGTKGGTISLKVPEESLIWQGDTLHMKNAIGNIIDNSIKYNVMAPVVCIGVKTEAGKVAITITDNGIGIDKEHQRLLFDKFYRVPTGNIHDVKGLGIGLNYVSLILKAHGGEVSCTSDLGKGSIFTLTFPYQS
jgi:two-component system phosphate regulon sensor histidine kinase PhoR